MAATGNLLRTVLFLIACASVAMAASGKKVWTIAIGHDWTAHEYIDDEGYLAGFNKDLIATVCAAARIECRTIWDKYTNCLDGVPGGHAFGGVGLLGGWYDACTGWRGTPPRMQIYDFSMPFLQPEQTYFYVKSTGSTFNPKDITGKTIGFMDGWVHDEKCLARHADQIKGAVLDKDHIVHFSESSKAIAAVRNGEIDALLMGTLTFSFDGVKADSSVSMRCTATGEAMMTRKDNEFNGHWNRGFQQIVANGQFRKLCQTSQDKHGHKGDLSPCV